MKLQKVENQTNDKEKLNNLQNEHKSILTDDYNKSINNLLNEIKNNISYKKINDVQIDCDTLFGILENYKIL